MKLLSFFPVFFLSLTLLIGSAAALPWTTETLERHIQETNFSVNGVCSSTLIDNKEGIILSAAHCFKEEVGSKHLVTQNLYEDHTLVGSFTTQVELIGKDKDNDLAVLKIVDGETPWTMEATLAEDAPTIGSDVWVVGNPFGSNDNSVSKGILSAKHRMDNGEEVWQTDAATTYGNSGGGVYNGDGEFIGVVSRGITMRGIGVDLNFFIPLYKVKEFLEKNAENL